MKTTLMRCLLLATLVSVTVLTSAQEKEDTLCIGEIFVRDASPVKSIFTADDDSFFDNYIVVNNDNIFGLHGQDYPMGTYPVRWVLTETSDRTILHCYIMMTEPYFHDFYLGGIDKASIVDLETGKIYEARGSYDPQVWNRAFNIAAPIGTVLDFPIEFPLLPKNVKLVSIYGVPLCNLNGVFGDAHDGINIRDNNFNVYDEVPHLKVPRCIKEESANYNADDWDTWAAYADVHTVRPCKDGVMALWRTPEATYLTVAYEQNWRTEYFSFDKFLIITDSENGASKKLRKVQGITNPEHLFMSHAEPGSWVCFTLEFDPLPLSTQYIELQYNDDLAKEGAKEDEFYVNTLRSNQKYFEYYKPDVTTLDASPMAVKTTKLDVRHYEFILVDSKTKKKVMNAEAYLLDKKAQLLSSTSCGLLAVPQYDFTKRKAVINADGYEPAVLSMSKYKPGKEYTISMNRLPDASKDK